MSVLCDSDIQTRDPVLDKIDFVNKDVLEIGCGTGGFTLGYLADAKSVYAVDPDSDSLDVLRENWNIDLNGSLSVLASNVEDANLPQQSFDVAIFSSSL